MLVLFETPAGYALFRTRGDGAQLLDRPDAIADHFDSAAQAGKTYAI